MTEQALLEEYERRFRANPDFWGFTTSAYERDKRAATIQACGTTRRERMLELGAANGVLAEELAALGRELVAVEGVPAAVAAARERLSAHAGVEVVQGLIPADVPGGPYDLVLASEILYYLDEPSYRATLAQLPLWLAPGGRLVAVHWRPAGPERPRTAARVHEDLAQLPELTSVASAPTEDYLLDAFERRT